MKLLIVNISILPCLAMRFLFFFMASSSLLLAQDWQQYINQFSLDDSKKRQTAHQAALEQCSKIKNKNKQNQALKQLLKLHKKQNDPEVKMRLLSLIKAIVIGQKRAKGECLLGVEWSQNPYAHVLNLNNKTEIYGLRISAVKYNSAASKAKLRAGDFIVKIGEIDLRDRFNLGQSSFFVIAIQSFAPSDLTTITYYRGLKIRKTKIRFQQAPNNMKIKLKAKELKQSELLYFLRWYRSRNPQS